MAAKIKDKVRVEVMDLNVLLAAGDENNPRVHTLEGDIKENAISLLYAGWAEVGVVYNELLKRLAGGHGRTMSADWLRQQSEDWFEDQYDKWLVVSEDRKAIAGESKERFNPGYWQRCPANVVRWDETTHNAMLIRLNNSDSEGNDDPKRMAALLAKLPKAADELAGWDSSMRNAFVGQFLQKVKDAPVEEDDEPLDFQSSQRFSTANATDYSVRDQEGLDDATEESGDVNDYHDPDQEGEWDDPDDEDDEFEDSDGNTVKMANPDTNIEEVATDIFKHSSHYSETRAILYVSQAELEDWKRLSKQSSTVFDVDRAGQVAKVWRSQATLKALEWAIQNHPDRCKLEVEPEATA